MTLPLRGRRGASSLGCLVSLLIFVAALYYGVHIGEVFFRYYRLVDEMDSQARLASAIDNGTIRRRLEAAIQDIGLPNDAADALEITRTSDPRKIHIETRYTERVQLPLFDHTFILHPSADESL
ncbi:MAG TPA: hypothetical protein VMC86_04860 [Gemmatimonadales bacterium]|nr:hypothetical protein [Gemmatimonadales bacterium]